MKGTIMKKKNIIVISIIGVALLVLLLPIKVALKDGGTKEYRALLYKVSKVHRLVPESELNEYINPYENGTVIEILGFEVYNDVK